jgi:hypothetical protein
MNSRRLIDVGRSCSTHVRMRNAYKDLDREPEKETSWETYVQMEGYY